MERRTGSETRRASRKYLWEVLVPRTQNGDEIPVFHHQSWDEGVRDITGGLTILKTARGHWVSPSGELFIEPMIPVRILCNSSQISIIADLVASHYQQEAVMYYRVSDRVVIKHYPPPSEVSYTGD